MLDPLDDYPLHQAPLSLAHVVTSDRNAYDRYYFNAHGRSGEPFLITGLGFYPNLGVVDAFATVRVGDRQVTVRTADALDGHDRLAPAVGPYRIEVIEPLRRLRLICDADDHGVGFDLTFDGSGPAVEESRHLWRAGPRVTLDAQRFAQLGSWSGELRVDGTTHPVDPEVWLGSRDRSWGIRPVGEAEPPGRAADEGLEGFWWCYVPLRFDDHQLVIIAQEEPDGHRVLNEAVRVWHDPDRPQDQLGWPRFEIRFRPGGRHPEGARIHLTESDGTPLTIEVENLGFVALNAGPGYGGDPTWAHGAWRGRDWIERHEADLTDPAVAGMIPFGAVDHVARAQVVGGRADGAEGWGMFELATFGRHDPTGFADWGAVAT